MKPLRGGKRRRRRKEEKEEKKRVLTRSPALLSCSFCRPLLPHAPYPAPPTGLFLRNLHKLAPRRTKQKEQLSQIFFWGFFFKIRESVKCEGRLRITFVGSGRCMYRTVYVWRGYALTAPAPGRVHLGPLYLCVVFVYYFTATGYSDEREWR